MISGECTVASASAQVKVSDARSTSAIFLNPKLETFHLIRFDGCVVKNTAACDWLVVKPNSATIAVELKGCDVDHAAEQILASMEYLKGKELGKLRLAGLIICSRYPKVDTKVQRLKQKLATKFRAPLHVMTYGRNLDFEKLAKFA
ncbi:hypothetical protein [Caenimonas koreensis]|uniref:hypothetical protein n=1 Tax=Caenimonas koreensis TaxID=367474 RepID=UPI0037849569